MKPQFFGFWPIFTAHDSSFFIFTPGIHLRWSFLRKSLYVELSSERVSIFIFTGSYILEITLTNFQPLSLFCSAAIGNFQSRQILLWIVFFTGVILFVRQLLIQNRQWNFKIKGCWLLLQSLISFRKPSAFSVNGELPPPIPHRNPGLQGGLTEDLIPGKPQIEVYLCHVILYLSQWWRNLKGENLRTG